VIINRVSFNAFVADGLVKRMIGLMFRTGLEENECMLFAFGIESFYGIWMRNMKFSIDAAWLDKNLKIVDIKAARMRDIPELQNLPAWQKVKIHPGVQQRNNQEKQNKDQF